MNLLDTLTRAADEEQLRLRPLPEHAAAMQAEHLRRHYALLLAAVLTAQPTISEPQTRLLRLLLDALKLGDIRGPLFEQARELTPEPLLEAARLIREAGFAHHLVLDVLVLLRLDAPLGDEAVRLVDELAAFLGIDEAELATRARDAVDILGLNTTEWEGEHSDASKEGDCDSAKEAAQSTLSMAEVWPSWLSEPLTTKALRGGLQGGLWVLDANLEVDFPWQANDAVLIFRNGATLKTYAPRGEVRLIDCRLGDAVLEFRGVDVSTTLERCDWRGNYDPAFKRTALLSIGNGRLSVTDCQFSTRNARTIYISGDIFTLMKTIFTRCGHEKISGGAIYFSGRGGRNEKIENCKFLECQGMNAGAIYKDNLYGVKNCEFYLCSSKSNEKHLIREKIDDIAIYSHGFLKDGMQLEGCFFCKNSMYIYSVEPFVVARNTKFKKGNIYYLSSGAEPVADGCSFVNGKIKGVNRT